MPNRSPYRWSLEVVPTHAHRATLVRGLVEEIFVTMIPGSEIKTSLAAIASLTDQGFIPVPHIAARAFKSEVELDGFLREIEQLGVRKALLLAGGASRSAGPFAQTLDLLQSKAFARTSLSVIGLAGHPEGNPDDPHSRQSLEKKVEFLRTAKLGLEIVTQWSFSPQPVSAFLMALRTSGLTETVAVGVAGPASLKTLLKYAQTCGVTASMDFMAKHGFSLSRLLMPNKPELFVHAVEGTDRFHLYPFGGLEQSAAWLESLKVMPVAQE